MTLKFIEDDEKIWALGVPVNRAIEVAPELDWEEVFIKVVDPPGKLTDSRISSKVSYIFSEIPISGGIRSSWHIKMEEGSDEDVEYVEVSPEELEALISKSRGSGGISKENFLEIMDKDPDRK